MRPKVVVFAAALLVATSVVTLHGSTEEKSNAGDLEKELKELSQKVYNLTLRTAALDANTDSLTRLIDFYATCSGPTLEAKAASTLIFDRLLTNHGDAYDPLTGVFTAPSYGLYFFQTVVVSGLPHRRTAVQIRVGNVALAKGIPWSRDTPCGSSAINVLVRLRAGQLVRVEESDGRNSMFLGANYTTFSGFLIKELRRRTRPRKITDLQSQSSDVEPDRVQISEEVIKLAAEVGGLELKTGSVDKVVAFYALSSVNHIEAEAYGTLIFNRSITNYGNAYDPSKGVFNVPASGLYYFQTVFMSYNLQSYVNVAIYVDGQLVARGISDSRNGAYHQNTLNIFVEVATGQKVAVKNPCDEVFHYYAAEYSSFSGFLFKGKMGNKSSEETKIRTSFQLQPNVMQLSQQVSSLTSRVAALELKTAFLDEEPSFAFFAYNTADALTVRAKGILVFDHVITNHGQAYSRFKGVFTVPTSGLYYFQTHFTNRRYEGRLNAGIYVDEHLMAMGISDSNNAYYDGVTINAILDAKAGQVMSVRNVNQTQADFQGNYESSISGFLIKQWPICSLWKSEDIC